MPEFTAPDHHPGGTVRGHLVVVRLPARTGEAVVLLLGLGWPVLQARRISRRLRSFDEPGATRIVLTDAEYAAESPGRTMTRAWTTFTNVALVRGFWVLKIEAEGKIAFPADLLDTTQTEVFRAAMRAKGLLAGSPV